MSTQHHFGLAHSFSISSPQSMQWLKSAACLSRFEKAQFMEMPQIRHIRLGQWI
jgi:hypothetical protein